MAKTPARAAPSPIDRLMERASIALEATRYFEAEKLAATALRRAHRAHDFERMSRIVLPLLEARRQKRQLAVDAGPRAILEAMPARRNAIQPGCYLLQPPLIGLDARTLRETADARQIPVLVLTREPLARDGAWPIVAVNGEVSIRTKVAPPWPLERNERRVCKDDVDEATPPPAVEWFEAAAERLGDAAIARLHAADPAAWRVDDLVAYLECLPDHEKLHQRLDEACRVAMTQPLPEGRRPRPLLDDPFSF